MIDPSRTNQELLAENQLLHQRITELEHSEAERKRAEEALKESEETYKTLAEKSLAGVYVVQNDKFRFINSNAASYAGYTKDELLDQEAVLLVRADDREKVRQNARAMLLGEISSPYEFRIVTKQGETRWIMETVTSISYKGRPAILGNSMDITDSKRAEEALKESEQRLHCIIDGSPIPAFVIGKDHLVIHWNKALEKMSSIKLEEVVGTCEHWKAFYREERPCMVDLLVDEIVESVPEWYSGKYIKSPLIEGAYEATDFFPTLGHAGKWLRFTAAAIRDSKGAIVAAIETLEDITERKRAEEALQESEKLFMDVLYNSKDAILLIDGQKFVDCNEATTRMLGYSSRDEFLMTHPSKLSPLMQPDGRSSFEKANEMMKIASEMGSHRFEWMHQKANGDIFPVEVSLIPIALHGKSIIYCVWRDITERKQAEEALRESEEKYRDILENIEDGYFEVDLAGNFTFFNPAMCRIVGFPREEMPGMNNRTFMDPENAKKVFRAFNEIYRTGIPTKGFQWETIRKDGSRMHIEVSASLIARPGEKPTGFRGIARDISERKLGEEALRKTNRELEAATARANMMAVQAESANRAKSEFLANMSHEIRTPMNGVIGMTGLLLDTELTNEQRKYAEIVRASGESLLSILNDILDFSKIEAGKLEMETLDFDLRALLDDFASTMALRAHDKGLEFICAAAPEVPAYLRGDPGRLRQILVNLMGNAVKFTHKGEISVRAGLAWENDDDAMIRFSIKDTGIGIPAGKQALMFQKFTQADASTTRQYGGTGLGLAISKQLAERMGGEIGFVSEEGHGSEFWFTACLGKQPEGAQTEILPTADIRGTHILVVDDNTTNREVLIAQLKAWGVRAEEAPDGPLALSALYRARYANDPFLAAILDMQMPGMDGAALARVIKADENLQDTRLVLLSSLGQRGDAKRMEEIGFAAYLTKPARKSELLGCLSTVLAGPASAQPAQPIVTRHAIRELRRGAVRILLAEDNITNQMVAVGILKKLGLRADAVANGAEAVRALETIPYDLILMDVQMPEMDGLEATRQIRDHQSAVRDHQLPIIAMTAHAMQGDRERCIAAGMNDYIAKPIDAQKLAEALEKWLPRETTGAKEQPPGKPEDPPPVSVLELEVPVFDKAGMMARLMGDDDLACAVIEGFLDDAPKQIEALRGYLEAGDAAGTERQAHSLKGASANLGGEALRGVAFAIEKAAKAGNLEYVKAHLPELENQFTRLKEAMDQYGAGDT